MGRYWKKFNKDPREVKNEGDTTLFRGFSRRAAFIATTAICLLLTIYAQSFAMGGGGADKDPPPDNTRRLKMTPLEENTHVYGWIRITPDTMSIGANRCKPDTYYTVYFVNGAEKQAVGPEPTVQASGSGEIKFSVRLTEPLGAKWTKVVLFQHTDDKPAIAENLKPFMEGSLR